MAIEAELTRRVGMLGLAAHGSLAQRPGGHDTRLYAKRRAGEPMAANVALREALIAQAGESSTSSAGLHAPAACPAGAVLSPYARLRADARSRDYDRLAAARNAADACPWERRWRNYLPLDRFATAEALGFDHPIPNSLDAVRPRLPARPHLRLQRVVFAPVAFVRGNRAVVVGGVRLHHAVGRLLHWLFHHALRRRTPTRSHPRQVGPGRAIWWPS